MTHVKIIADSLHPVVDSRVITVEARIPTVALAQLNTHGMFAKNAASMRAIPTEDLIKAIQTDPYMPQFGANQKGMVAGEPIPPEDRDRAEGCVREHLDAAIRTARQLHKLKVHKEDANRYLMPFSWSMVVITGHDAAWANFLAQRAHPAAFPPLRAMAFAAKQAIRDSEPTRLRLGQWHTPYSTDGDVKVSVARCARVSYRSNLTGKESTRFEDVALYGRLVEATPKHASPLEHQLRPVLFGGKGRAGRFWIPHRHELQNHMTTDLKTELSK